MKLWKRTVVLMLVTLLVSLGLVGGLSLYITGSRSLNNMAETCGRQLNAASGMLEQFWDSSKYNQMSEVGQRSYREFQLQLCCGEGYALIDASSGEAAENMTGYEIVDMNALGLSGNTDAYSYKLQRLNGKILMLQNIALTKPEAYELLSVRDITEVFQDLRQTALWFLGIYVVIFVLAGLFIYRMMRRTVSRMEELEEVAEKQEVLLGALAHEMKTPLTSIVGYSDTLKNVRLSEEQQNRALEHINREGRRLSALSGKLLQLLGLHRNEAIRMERQPAAELFDRVLTAESEKAKELGIRLNTETEDFEMEMDPALMESLLLNLTDNALKASKEGGTVTLRAYTSARKKIFEVEDEGTGIPEAELPKITEAFYMVDKSRSRQNGGSGLGLALCERIAELHGGKMEIKSRSGEGTLVKVVFR